MSSAVAKRIRGLFFVFAGVSGLCFLGYSFSASAVSAMPEDGNSPVDTEMKWKEITGRVVSPDAPNPMPSAVLPSGAVFTDHSLVVSNENDGLANVVVLARSSLLNTANSGGNQRLEVTNLTINESGISPRYIIVQRGGVVRLQNSTKYPIELRFYLDRTKQSRFVAALGSIEWTPPPAQTPIQIGVPAKSWMAAFVIPSPDDGMAVLTDADGRFRISVPEGSDARIQFWHERPRFISRRDISLSSPLARGTRWDSRTLMIDSETVGDISLNEIQIPGRKLEIELAK